MPFRQTLKSTLDLSQRISDALSDPARRGRTVVALIAAYVALWTLFGVVSNSSQDIHNDMAEIFAWSLDPAFGYPKHPPFAVWVALAWFTIFPRADWAYYLLSMTNVGFAMWFIWLIAGQVVSGHKRTAALMLLAFSPVFNFVALKFNHNSLLVPVWAAAAWLFLRSWRDRTAMSGAFAGFGAAIAMMTKYWSIFLIVGFAAAALMDRRRGVYFRSPAPYVSVLVGAVAIALNIASLVHYDFHPFQYATAVHAASSVGGLLYSLVSYLSGLLYLAGAAIVLVLACRPTPATWLDMLWPRDGDRRFMAMIQWAAFLAPLAVAVVMREHLSPLWTLAFWPMLPALMLSSKRIEITRRAAAGILTAAYAVPCIALAVAPALSLVALWQGADNSRIYFSLVAHEVDRLWPTVSHKPLRFVTGPPDLSWGCTFYCRDMPRAVPNFSNAQTPWIDITNMERDGFAALCSGGDEICLADARHFATSNSGTREETVELSRNVFGVRRAPRRFTLVLVPPRQ